MKIGRADVQTCTHTSATKNWFKLTPASIFLKNILHLFAHKLLHMQVKTLVSSTLGQTIDT